MELQGVDVFYPAARVLHVAPGEIMSLLGGSPSGKSTTMKTVLGLVRPKRGQAAPTGNRAACWAGCGR
ncbi:MAG: ATP-binding cassette domain-containing protein [Chloroflexota bacterium]